MKHLSGIVVRLLDMETLEIPENENAAFSTVRTLSGMTKLFRAVHPQNAASPMDVTVLGIVTDSRF